MPTINSLIKGAARDTVYYTACKIIVGLTGFLSIKLFTALFTPHDYGDYTLVNTTANVLIMIFFGWLTHSGFRFVEEYSSTIEEKKRFYSTLFLSAAAVTLGSAAAALLIAPLTGLEINLLILGGIFFLATQSNSLLLFNLIRAYRLSKVYSVLMALHALLKLGLIYVLAEFAGMGVESIFFGGAILDLVVIVIMSLKLELHRFISLKCFSREKFYRFFSYGSPLIGVSIATWVLSASDKYIIKIFRTSAEVGIYSISYSLVASGFTLLNASLMLGMYPVILQNWIEEDQESTEELIGKIIRYYLLIAMPACAGLSLLARPVLQVLSSPEYISGFVVVPWVAAGLVFLGLTEYVTKIWELQKSTAVIFYLMIAASVFNIILNFLLVPHYGFQAAAITTAVSYLLYLLLAYVFSRKKFTWRIDKISLLRIGLATGIMSLIIIIFVDIMVIDELKLVLGIPLGSIVYFSALFFTGEINDEINQLKQYVKKWGL